MTDALTKFMAAADHGHCGYCRRTFRDCEPTATGTDKHGGFRIVGECCSKILKEIHALGVANVAKIDPLKPNDWLGVPENMRIQVDANDAPWKDDDRAWFRRNHSRTHRIRPLFPGEMAAVGVDWPHQNPPLVILRQTRPGSRQKILIEEPFGIHPDGDAVLDVLFTAVVDAMSKGADKLSTDAIVTRIAERWPGLAQGGGHA